MKEVPLSRGMVAMVDDADYDRVMTQKWCVFKVTKRTAYAGCYLRDSQQYVSLHRFIMQPSAEVEIDHRNRDGLDNQRHNLRECTGSQNVANRGKFRGASRYIGVTADRGKWKAHYEHAGVHRNIGRFETEDTAARARDAAVSIVFGEFAYLNFPNEPRRMSLLDRDPTRHIRAVRTVETCPKCGGKYMVAGMPAHLKRCPRPRVRDFRKTSRRIGVRKVEAA
jgi:hypothetical protein